MVVTCPLVPLEPCVTACPTHIDVPKFIKRIASGNLRGSATAILDANILGLSCSRVCPVDVLCEGACVMHRYNKQPIEIGRLQRTPTVLQDMYTLLQTKLKERGTSMERANPTGIAFLIPSVKSKAALLATFPAITTTTTKKTSPSSSA